jgi:dolichol-phosphate mannosyltransferase
MALADIFNSPANVSQTPDPQNRTGTGESISIRAGTTMEKHLTALPVFNEQATVNQVLDQVKRFSEHVLVVDDGSTDGTAAALAGRSDIVVATHESNRGYGAALVTAFRHALGHGFDSLVTIDCDGQHEPQRINELVAELGRSGADIVSGSRYLQAFDSNSEPPAQRRWINQQITRQVNELLGFHLTDAFCGFKAYRVDALRPIRITEPGYAMPLELWVQAAFHKLKIVEVAVPLIYLDEKRSFGGDLDDATTRLNYYHEILQRSMERLPTDSSGVCCPELSG